MANRTVLLCLFILCSLIFVTECGRFGSRGGSRSGGGSSWGRGWGGGSRSGGSSWSSGSSYKPSSSSSGSGWFGSSSGSSYKPSSSSSGSGWFGSSSGGSSSSSSWNTGSSYKPSSSWNTGSSSSSSGSHSYPSSSSGLSGTGSGSYGYPSSSSGLSGTGSKPSSYPSSSSGLSGSGSSGSSKPWYNSNYGSGSHSYPSGSGLSGTGSGSSSHTYPSGSGFSGTSSGGSYRPTNTYHTNSGYGSHHSYVPPVTYNHYPQHVYVTQYRDSGSRYGDLLTGLTWYNLGRSHSHYHDHYYYDDYYHRNHYQPNSQGYISNNVRPEEKATCTLRITENGRLEILSIPCSIVSTFTQDSQQITKPRESYVNKTVCTTNSTVTKITPQNASKINVTSLATTVKPMYYIETTDPYLPYLNNLTIDGEITVADDIKTNKTTIGDLMLTGHAKIRIISTNLTNTNGTVKPIIEDKNITEGNTTTRIYRVLTTTEEIKNVTVCTTMTDPLSVKGPPIDPTAMECVVDIQTNNAYFRNKVDCNMLMKYSRRPPPQKESSFLPERQKLESWLQKPPWWMSMFIVV